MESQNRTVQEKAKEQIGAGEGARQQEVKAKEDES